jgi:hypothetical protein
MGAHTQLFRDALHAISLGAAAFALFGDAETGTRIAYMLSALTLHALAHTVVAAGRVLDTKDDADD